MSNSYIIKKTECFVKEYMKDYDDSHSSEHVFRVRDLAVKIAKNLNLDEYDIFEIELGALTHDINEHKYRNTLETQKETLENFFKDFLNKSIMDNVITIACNVSLSKEIELINNNTYIISKPLECVRDADRIESLGAIGISRYFTYGIKNKNNNISEVIKNIESRTSLLMMYITTNMGKHIANEKYKIIELFINDYYASL